MRQNYSQRLEMQIPQETNYIGISNRPSIEVELKEILNNHFEFPSNNFEDIIKYIHEDNSLETLICDLPKIISKEFPQSPILLDLTEDSLPNENILQIAIKTPYDGETTSHKKDRIMDEIFSKYKSTKKYYYIHMEF